MMEGWRTTRGDNADYSCWLLVKEVAHGVAAGCFFGSFSVDTAATW